MLFLLNAMIQMDVVDLNDCKLYIILLIVCSFSHCFLLFWFLASNPIFAICFSLCDFDNCSSCLFEERRGIPRENVSDRRVAACACCDSFVVCRSIPVQILRVRARKDSAFTPGYTCMRSECAVFYLCYWNQCRGESIRKE